MSLDLFTQEDITTQQGGAVIFDDGVVIQRLYSRPGMEILSFTSPDNQRHVCKRFYFANNRTQVEQQAFREFEIMSKCNHPNVLACYDFRSFDRYCEIVMEAADGPLNPAVLTQQQKIMALIQVCSGLHHIHSKMVVHADLKCENVFMVMGVAKIADFGSSIDFEYTTNFGSVLRGTPSFMAPEVITKSIYTPAADIWSFGALIFQLYLGQVPFAELEAPHAIIFHVGANQAFDPIYPRPLEFHLLTLIKKCTQVRLQDRPLPSNILYELKRHLYY